MDDYSSSWSVPVEGYLFGVPRTPTSPSASPHFGENCGMHSPTVFPRPESTDRPFRTTKGNERILEELSHGKNFKYL